MRRSFVVLALLLGPSFVGAQVSPPAAGAPVTEAAEKPVDPKKRALILEILNQGDTKKMAEAITDAIFNQIEQSFPQTANSILASQEGKKSPEELEKMKRSIIEGQAKFSKRLRELFLQNVDLAEISRAVNVPLYDRLFTEDELRELLAFNSSPLGRKVQAVMPQIMSAAMEGTNRLLGPKVSALVAQALKEQQEESAKAATAGKTPEAAKPPAGP